MARPMTELPRQLGTIANGYIISAERRFKDRIPAGVKHQFSGSLGNYTLRRTPEEEIDLRIELDGRQVTHFILSGAGAIRDREGRTVHRNSPLVDVVLVDIWTADMELRKNQEALEVVA